MIAKLEKRYTLEEYFELERTSEERFEFFNGEIFCMSGASATHNRILTNFIFHLRLKLQGRKCEIFPSDMRVKVPSAPPYRYPDLSALCGEAQFEKVGGVDTFTNPGLIVEVLSLSTEGHDRGEKFSHYKSIPSFGEYLLVAQHRPHVTQFIKHDERTWLQREFNDLEAGFTLSSLVCELTLREIYQNVVFDETHALSGGHMTGKEMRH